MEFGDDYLAFVAAHRDDDPARLRLKFHGDPRPWLPYAVNNIAALRKSRKFRSCDGSDFTPRVIPLEVSAQQSTSADIARLHQSLAGDAPLRILDMTFGLGLDAFLLSSNPQNSLTGCDLQEILVEAARVNFARRENVEVICADSVNYLREYAGTPFDLIFIDPGRRGAEGTRLYNLHDCQPDITQLLALFREKSSKVMAKLSPMLDVTQTIRDLPGLTELHVVEEEGECKELLAVLDFTRVVAEPRIIVDRLVLGNWQSYSFLQSEESALRQTSPRSGLNCLLPIPGMFILEPSAATMKAAPFNLLSRDFNTGRLHPNTQLYLSDRPHPDFPGKSHEIIKVWPFTSSNMKAVSREIPRADITLRNFFGFTADSLRKRLKIKPGGDLRLYAATVMTSSGPERFLLLTR